MYVFHTCFSCESRSSTTSVGRLGSWTRTGSQPAMNTSSTTVPVFQSVPLDTPLSTPLRMSDSHTHIYSLTFNATTKHCCVIDGGHHCKIVDVTITLQLSHCEVDCGHSTHSITFAHRRWWCWKLIKQKGRSFFFFFPLWKVSCPLWKSSRAAGNTWRTVEMLPASLFSSPSKVCCSSVIFCEYLQLSILKMPEIAHKYKKNQNQDYVGCHLPSFCHNHVQSSSKLKCQWPKCLVGSRSQINKFIQRTW